MECCGVGQFGGVKQCGVLWSRALHESEAVWSVVVSGRHRGSEAVWSVVESDSSL